ncbi:MAG: cyclic nucleotide-binding domain-containing protein [Pseudomonadota bacterium]
MTETVEILAQFPDLAKAGREEIFPPNTNILLEGEIGGYMYVVLQGMIDVSAKGEPLDVLEPGEVLGEMALVEGGNRMRSASAVSTTTCKLLRIEAEQFQEIAERQPEFLKLIEQIAENRAQRIQAIQGVLHG